VARAVAFKAAEAARQAARTEAQRAATQIEHQERLQVDEQQYQQAVTAHVQRAPLPPLSPTVAPVTPLANTTSSNKQDTQQGSARHMHNKMCIICACVLYTHST